MIVLNYLKIINCKTICFSFINNIITSNRKSLIVAKVYVLLIYFKIFSTYNKLKIVYYFKMCINCFLNLMIRVPISALAKSLQIMFHLLMAPIMFSVIYSEITHVDSM